MSNTEMEKQRERELFTLVTEDGVEIEAELIDQLEHDGHRYYLIGDVTPEDEQEVFIFEVQTIDGEEYLEEVLDEELECKIFELFKEQSEFEMWIEE